MTTLDPASTALVLIDLQEGIVGMDGLAPRSGPQVVETCRNLAARFREARAPVALVHVALRDGEMPSQKVDKPLNLPAGGTPPGWYQFVDNLREPDDIVVLKHHWGAFTGTDLDLQLRRRGVRTIVVAGIATNMGVESTVRSAWEHSYNVVVAEDACTSRGADLHAFAVTNILPQIARVTSADAISLS
jgi:nicotinamidase-related amidase